MGNCLIINATGDAVTLFARLTGDLRNLSKVDIHVAALAHDLEVKVYGASHLKKEPKKVTAFPGSGPDHFGLVLLQNFMFLVSVCTGCGCAQDQIKREGPPRMGHRVSRLGRTGSDRGTFQRSRGCEQSGGSAAGHQPAFGPRRAGNRCR